MNVVVQLVISLNFGQSVRAEHIARLATRRATVAANSNGIQIFNRNLKEMLQLPAICMNRTVGSGSLSRC